MKFKDVLRYNDKPVHIRNNHYYLFEISLSCNYSLWNETDFSDFIKDENEQGASVNISLNINDRDLPFQSVLCEINAIGKIFLFHKIKISI